MSDRTPTLQQLLTALRTLEDWFVFGVKLDVPYRTLKKIESSYGQRELERCKTDMLQCWLDKKLVPKWNEVILALEETDQLALAARIKHDYLLSTESDIREEEAVTPSPPSGSASQITTPPLATDVQIKAMIKPFAVVSCLKDLEDSFGHMIMKVKRHLEKCDLSEAKSFLYSVIGNKTFNRCENFGEILDQLLQQDHIDAFDISILQQLVACFDKCTEVIKTYNKQKKKFLKKKIVLEFQRAVVSSVEPILGSGGKAVVTIVISREMAYSRTLKDIEKLAMEGFEECHKEFILLHAESN